MQAFERWQEAISQNLASASVDGYRRNEPSFQSVAEDVSKLKNAQGEVQKSVKGYVPEFKSTLSNAPGMIVSTGQDTNFAIEGDGFFRVRKPDGTFAYTRNGNFRLSPDFTLVTQQGYQVDGDNGPLQFRQEGGAVLLNPQGLILQGTLQIGRLAPFKFNRPTEMTRVGDGLLAPAPGDAAQPIEGQVVVHRALEASNVSTLREMVSMVTVSRAYEMARKVVEIQDDTAGKAIQTLGNPVS